jgi:hypothetical protein
MAATKNWSRANVARATAPSVQETFLSRKIVASVEPSATVTTRSKALSLASVRFPEVLKMTTTVT